jgi:iron complex outermembrane receptor protein
MRMIAGLSLGSAIAVSAMTATPACAQEARRAYDIPAQPLASALVEFSRQSDVVVTVASRLVRGKEAPALRGSYTAGEALQLLLRGSGLRSRPGRNGGFFVEAAPAQTAEAQETASSSGDDAETDASQEIVVTGTNIRGAAPIGSPLDVYDRNDFNQSGAATVTQFLDALPQNFGGQSDDTFSRVGASFNPSFGTAVNLRGLGAGATLVLLNGKRLAPSGLADQYVDISMIPLTAVERIEVLPDGASAVYGSDAVAGVVNFITSRDYDGADSRLRFGASSNGDAEELRLSQSMGSSWRGGGVVFSAEHYERNNLVSSDRAFSDDELLFDLTPRTRSTSFFIDLRHEILPGFELFGRGLSNLRRSILRSTNPFSLEVTSRVSDTFQASTITGGRVNISETWDVEGSVGWNRNEVDLDRRNPGQNEATTSFTTWTADARANGNLLNVPAGPVRASFGASYRKDAFNYREAAIRDSSSSWALFAEINAPIIYDGSGPLFELSTAARYERYRGFGGAFNPKIGAQIRLSSFLRLRGSYGRSFRAPNLVQTDEFFQRSNALINIPNPMSPTGFTRSVLISGNNPELGEERSRSITVGADLNASNPTGIEANITYFDIRYRDRIIAPDFGDLNTIFARFSQAGLILSRGEGADPEFDALVSTILSGQTNRPTTRPSGCPVAFRTPVSCLEPVGNFNAIIDARLQNLAETRVNGIDFSIARAFEFGKGSLRTSLNASYLFNSSQKLTPATPRVSILDTLYNPVDFRLRGGVSWTTDRVTAAANANYVDGYTNNRAADTPRVSSWTTVDLHFGYRFGSQSTMASGRGVSVSLNVRNLFGQAPPAVTDELLGSSNVYGYDSANADPYGRLLSIELRTGW